MTPRVLRTPNFVKDAVSLILETGREAIARSGMFRLGLAGGGTPRAVYKALAARADDLPWECVQITFGDERCVPADSPDSNFHMAFESLLCRVPLPVGNVFQIEGEIDPNEAATQCEAQLAAVAKRMGESIYRHDLLLLGLGEDGHTASLFPGTSAPAVRDRWVTIGEGKGLPRITLTVPVLSAARQVIMLVSGAGKAQALRRLMDSSESGDRTPARLVAPQAEVLILADVAAASTASLPLGS
jgi:6-phosphogluconolactonase